jgi:hypothetical protein
MVCCACSRSGNRPLQPATKYCFASSIGPRAIRPQRARMEQGSSRLLELPPISSRCGSESRGPRFDGPRANARSGSASRESSESVGSSGFGVAAATETGANLGGPTVRRNQEVPDSTRGERDQDSPNLQGIPVMNHFGVSPIPLRWNPGGRSSTIAGLWCLRVLRFG